MQNGPQKKLEVFSDLPVRPATPPPSNPAASMPIDEPSAFNVIPGESSDRTAFLSEPWALELSKRYHFRMVFNGSYYVVSLVGRTALTLVPSSCGKDGIHLGFSNNHGKKKHETIKSCYLSAAPLRRVTKDLEVAVLQGQRQGQVFRVQSLNKKREICRLLAADRHMCEEPIRNICIVMHHKQEGCECAL